MVWRDAVAESSAPSHCPLALTSTYRILFTGNTHKSVPEDFLGSREHGVSVHRTSPKCQRVSALEIVLNQ